MKLEIKSKGQMLIEIVIAVGILALVLVGVSDLMTRSSRITTFQKKRDEAYTVARSIINTYRLQKDSDPGNFESNVIGLNMAICEEGKDFSCLATISKNNGSVDISVKVSWPEGQNVLSITMNQTFGNL
jgi:type II secretory pathway pseudopilin PulG